MSISALPSRLDFVALLEQRGRMLQLQCALPQLALVPERLVLREAVSRPFELALDALSSSVNFELKTLVGEQISVRLLQPTGEYKSFHGYVFEAAQLGADGGLARYRLVMRPWLSFLALRHDTFTFQDKTVREIVEEVFKDFSAANFRFELSADNSAQVHPRSLCVQYRESDLAFVSRLLAEEGLSYHFEHLEGASGDGDAANAPIHAKHVLVITDRASVRPSLGTARFTSQHPTANVLGQLDSVTAFMVQRSVQANAVTLGSWNYKTLAGSAGHDSTALAIGELPQLEIYNGSGAYRANDAEHAQRAAALALAALELDFERFEGQGSTRHFEAGRRFTLIDHPLYGANTTAFNYAGGLAAAAADDEFVLLAVEHHATNNLGSQAAELLQSTELERGTYKNHFHAAPAAAPVVPRFIRKPTARGAQTALVVGLQGEAITTERDLRVKVQFPWQRGQRPNAGGLAHTSPVDALGNAPGNEASGTWLRVAQAAAGANWGAVFTPRIGSEVSVAFIEDDIDRPLITGGLYNGVDAPPFAAGVDSGVNHPGVIDGIHSQALDNSGFNEWVMDNATGQLRMRLHASVTSAELGLGHLIQQGAATAQRGAWRGSGFEAGTQGWASVRAGKGLLVSTTARAGTYGSAQSTQMDAAEAVAQLKGARALGGKLSAAASQATAAALTSHDSNQAFDSFIKGIDPKQDGKHAGPVNGQEAKKANGRALTDPVEAFDKPFILLDTPATSLWATEASIAAFAGQDFSLAAQGDIQHTAAHTFASISGQTTSWFTHEGGLKAYAANGPVSLQAHTDALQILADKDVTVISVNDEVTVAASTRIELVAGQSSIVLDGANIDFTCPGNWQVKASAHAFLGGGSQTAALPTLPDSRVKLFDQQVRAINQLTGKPIAGLPYKLTSASGDVLYGTTDEAGKTFRAASVSQEAVRVEWGVTPPTSDT